MKNNNFLFLILSLFGLPCFAITTLISTGHREAMQANGGLTNLCSAGQFLKNPAGLHCESKDALAESFASTSFYAAQTKVSDGSGTYQDLQGSEVQTGPGLSIFSQSAHQDNLSYGMWGAISNVNQERSYSYTPAGGSKGTIQTSNRDSQLLVGTYLAGKSGSLSWGVSVGFNQSEQKESGFVKYLQGGQYITQFQDELSIERRIISMAGITYEGTGARYSLAIKPEGISTWGKTRSEITRSATSGSFDEFSKDGNYRTSGGFGFAGGAEFLLTGQNSFGFDFQWINAGTESYGGLKSDLNVAPTISVGGYGQLQISQKLSLVGGGRWTQSVNETEGQQKMESPMASIGLLRKYKAAEIGSGISFGQITSKSYQRDAQTSENSWTMNRLDIVLSSSFTY